MKMVIWVPSTGTSRRVLVKERSSWKKISQYSPARPVWTSTAFGLRAKTEMKPMPNLPIFVRSSSLVDEKSRVS